MSHEKSETVQRPDGKWINVYGEGTGKAGQRLLGSKAFDTVDEAVSAARARSESFDSDGADDAPEVTGEYQAKREQDRLNEAGRWVLEGAETTPPGGEDAPPTPVEQQLRQEQQQDAGEPGFARTAIENVSEVPRQAVGGVSDAVHNTFMALDGLANWLNENVADLRFDIPDTGVEQLDLLIQEPLKALAGRKGEVADARTMTGALTRDMSRFLTGFVPAFRAAKAAGAGQVTGSMGAGAVSDFLTADPQQARLADLWGKLGLPENELTDYLASDPGDSEIEGRFKNMVEGAGLGGLTEGFMAGARAVRSMVHARAAAKGTAPAMEASARLQYGEVADDAFGIFGDPSAPRVKIGRSVAATREYDVDRLTRAGEAGGEEVFVNFSRIDTADDVKDTIGRMARAFAGDIDEARRGVQSNEATKALADDLGMTVDGLLRRRKGQPLNAEEALAARRLWTASAEKLTEAAKRAADPNAGAVDQFNFRRMMAMHHAIQAEVVGARTETARALQSWSIPAGGGVEKARGVQQIMEQWGGSEVSREMAKRLSLLADTGASKQAINVAAQRGWAATTMDAVRESFVLGLLWSPSTHFVNTLSNAAVAAQQIVERGLAANVSRGMGRAAGQGVEPGEASMMAYGLIMGLRDAFRMAGRSVVTGQTGRALGKIDLPHEASISSQAVARELGRPLEGVMETGLGKAIDMIGFTTRIPGRLLAGEDEFFKTIGYRMELHAQALRTAVGEGLKGKPMARRMAEIVSNPPENVRIAAADAALYNTFTNQPGQWAQSLMGFRNAGALNPTFAFLPFVRTPANILRYTFERSPVAPLVGQWRADIAAGGARADTALARMATGSATMAVAADLAFSGQVTGAGPSQAGERGVREAMIRQGWQPNSVRVGDEWVSYQRTDPFGMLMGFSASMAEIFNRRDLAPEDYDEFQEFAAAATMAVSRTVVDKTYFEGISRIIEAIQDPERYGPGYVNDLIASFVPATTALGTATRAVDPTAREVNDPLDAIQARMLTWAQKLPPRRDLWGEEKRPDEVYGRAYDVLSPFYVRQVDPNPIDSEIERLRLNLTRIDRRGQFEGVPVNLRDWPEVYDAYVRLAGNDLEDPAWGMGAKDYLSAVVSGEHSLSPVYEMMPDAEKESFIRSTVQRYREMARQQILTDPEFADFRDAWDAKKTAQDAARLPAGVAPQP